MTKQFSKTQKSFAPIGKFEERVTISNIPKEKADASYGLGYTESREMPRPAYVVSWTDLGWFYVFVLSFPIAFLFGYVLVLVLNI